MDLSKFWRRFTSHKPAPASGASREAGARVTAPESRVGPRASAWVEGQWEKSHYQTPAAGVYPSLALDYGLYVPQGAAGKALPLVVMLHGCSQSSEAFARGTRMNVLADRYGFAVLYPEQAAKRHAQACWHWYDTTTKAGGAEAHAIISLLDRVVEQHGFDATRIYVAGLSAGAGMATLLAFDYPDRFAAVATHSGVVFGAAHSVPSALDAMRRGSTDDPAALVRAALQGKGVNADDTPGHPGIPALLLHGARDELVNPVNLEQLEAQFLALNGLLAVDGTLVDVTLAASEHDTYRQRIYRRDGQELVKVYLVAELGHAWSGGDDTVPFHACIGPDASEEIWSFFSKARRLPQSAKSLAKAVGIL